VDVLQVPAPSQAGARASRGARAASRRLLPRPALTPAQRKAALKLLKAGKLTLTEQQKEELARDGPQLACPPAPHPALRRWLEERALAKGAAEARGAKAGDAGGLAAGAPAEARRGSGALRGPSLACLSLALPLPRGWRAEAAGKP